MERRWHVLLLCCIISFSVDFFYDEPSALVQRLTGASGYCINGSDAGCLQLSMIQYNSFFSGFSWASGIAAVLFGFAADKYGPSNPLWLSMGVLFAGGLMFTVGSYSCTTKRAFSWMISGRVFFGAGNGAVVTICHQIKAAWFQYKELALAFALHIVAGRLGSALNYLLIGGVVTSIGLSNTLWIGFGITLLACIAIVDLIRTEERIHETGMPQSLATFKVFLLGLNGLFWSFAAVVFLLYGVVTTFTANAVALMADIYKYPEGTASYMAGIVFDVALVSPLVAFFLDRYGRRDYWITASAALLLLSLLIALAPGCPGWLLTLIIGFAYAIFPTTIWSSLPLIVPQNSIGAANGLLKFFQYIGVGIVTLIGGAVLDNYDKRDDRRWKDFILLLAITALVSLLVAVWINWLNGRSTGPLSMSQAQRRARSKVEEISPLRLEGPLSSYGKQTSVLH